MVYETLFLPLHDVGLMVHLFFLLNKKKKKIVSSPTPKKRKKTLNYKFGVRKQKARKKSPQSPSKAVCFLGLWFFLFAQHNTRSLVDSPPLTFGTTTNISILKSSIYNHNNQHRSQNSASLGTPTMSDLLSGTLSLSLSLSKHTHTNIKSTYFYQKVGTRKTKLNPSEL